MVAAVIFTAADRARMEVIDAKLDAIQAQLSGYTLRGLRTEITNLVPMLDKLMQSHAALSTQLSGTGDGLAAAVGEHFQSQREELGRLIVALHNAAAKPKKPRKRKK